MTDMDNSYLIFKPLTVSQLLCLSVFRGFSNRLSEHISVVVRRVYNILHLYIVPCYY